MSPPAKPADPYIRVRFDADEAGLLLEALDGLSLASRDLDRMSAITALRARIVSPALKFGAEWAARYVY